jgi:hypothetical protein
MNEARGSAVITHSAAFPMCHTDPTTGGRFRSSRREASASPHQITDHEQDHMTHSEGQIRRSHLNEVVYREKNRSKLSKLFTKKINGIILGDMTRPESEV